MRLFHLSDLHIGIKLYNHDLREVQEELFAQIADYAGQYQPDAILIAGDIYDKAVPSAEAVQLFDSFLESLYDAAGKTEIMIVSGNHDSAQRIDYLNFLLAKQRVHMVGIPPRTPEESIEKVTLDDEHGAVNFYLLPFCKPSVIRGTFDEGDTVYSYNDALHQLFARENVNEKERNVLVSHQFYLPSGKKADEIERMESEITAVGNVDVVAGDVLAPFEYAALGHIHKPMTVGADRFRYCGTPFAYSVSEANQEKGLLMIELGRKGEEPEITKLPLVPSRKVVVIEDTFENVLKQATEDYAQIILTDDKDLEIFDLQERIAMAFPNQLEIQRKYARQTGMPDEMAEPVYTSPYELICQFIPDMDEEEQDIMKSVINEALGGAAE
ncbi:MAG: exonuclease SbcCD subunit D [Lachnospiraceae bacterium]|nr:exonuclease SbcCD subunit D [Lachnospiraceae bacterium]